MPPFSPKSPSSASPDDLRRLYEQRFGKKNAAYRSRLWKVLIADYFQRYVRSNDAVLDLGCGYGDFINNVRCGLKYAIDLNPNAPLHLGPDVIFFGQDCSSAWPLPAESLDVVFTSNFFEHLPDKCSLERTLVEAAKALKPGGRLIALGPNIKIVHGDYWDFWDHHLPLTEQSLAEVLTHTGFSVKTCLPQFLPFTTINQPRYPTAFVRLYLRISLAWRFFGGQFLLVAAKPPAAERVSSR